MLTCINGNQSANAVHKKFNVHHFILSGILSVHLGLVSNAYANPEGGVVVGGRGSIQHSGTNTTVNQSSQNMAIDWRSYNVQQNERVQYIQPNSSSISLNRIIGNNASQIHGRIDANGQVILVNPNGIFFSATSSINVGGIMASGLDIKPDDFMNGNYIFNEVAGSNGFVMNSGIINAATGGNVTLLGKQVKNDGMIVARLGAVNMAAGKQAVVTFDNAGLLGIKITKEVLQNELGIDPAVLNNGTINAEAGRILLTASVSQDIFSSAVNTGGMEQATSAVVNADGTFTLGGGADAVNTGVLDVSVSKENTNAGEIIVIGENVTSSGVIKSDAENGNGGNIEIHAADTTRLTENSATSSRATLSGKGGSVKILGNKVGLFEQAQVDVSGAHGGGVALIGGDKTGANKQVRNAEFIYLGETTSIKADAVDKGTGGKLIAFASDSAKIYGNLYARGGANGGNGGFIETSGLKGFEISQAPDATAVMGLGGEWLIDPYNISIIPGGGGATSNIKTTNTTVSGTKVFDPTGTPAAIGVDLITSQLDNGTNVTITTTEATGAAAGSEAGDITFNTNLLYTGDKDVTLTLNAANDIILNSKQVRANLDSKDRPRPKKTLDIVFNANSDGIGGGDVNLTNAQISTNGGNFTATGVNFSSTGGEINTVRNNYDISGSGNNNGIKGGTVNISVTGRADEPISITHPASINIGGDIITDGGAVSLVANLGTSSAGGGDITTTALIDTTTQPFVSNVSGGKDRDAAATNTGTVTMTADAVISLGGSILTDGKNITVTKSNSFTNTGAINTSGDTQGDVSISSSGAVTVNGAITTNNGFFRVRNTSASYESNAAGRITTNGGNVTLESNGSITSGGQINAGSGSVSLSNLAGAGGVSINNGITTTGSSGTLAVNSNGVINAAAAPLVIGGKATFLNTGNNAITLTGANNFQGKLQLTNANGAVSINDINNIDFAFSNVGVGALTVTAGGNISQSGTGNTLTQVAGTGTLASFTAGGAITLNDSNNDFAGTLSLNNTTGNVVVSDVNNIDFATSNLGNGSLTVNATGMTQTGGAITQNTGGAGRATFNAGTAAITLNNSANDFTGEVSLNNSGAFNVVVNDSNNITLAASNIGQDLTVTAGAASDVFQNTTDSGLKVAGNATFYVDGGRSISLGNTSNQFTGLSFLAKAATGTTLQNITVANSLGLDLQTLNLTGDLNVNANGDILNTTGGMSVAGNTILNANGNNILLDKGANNFNNVSVSSANNLTITDINGISFSGLTLSGDLSVTANGNVNQTAAIDLATGSVATINAGTGQINLATSANDFDTLNLASSAAVNIDDTLNSNGVTLDNVSITGGGTLTVTASGNINDTANNIQVAGLASFTANNRSITLNRGSNDFSRLAVSAASLAVQDINSLTLNTINLTGSSTSLNIKTSGLLNQTAAIVNSGNTVIDTGANVILLSNTNNDFIGTVSLTNIAGNVIIADANSIDFATTSLGNGSFTVNAGQVSGGGISQTGGRITQAAGAGAVTLNAGAGTIALGDTGNDFSGALYITNTGASNNVVIADINNIALAQSSIGGNLDVTAGTASDITQNNTDNGLTVGGTATFNVDSGRSIILGNINNNFNGLSFQAKAATGSSLRDVTVANSSALDLQTLDLSGNLSVTAAGAISNTTGSMKVAGLTTLNAGSNNITLATGANDFNELVITAANDVAITDINTINIGDAAGNVSNINGDISITANGNITQTAALTMQANTTATFNAGSGGIDLGSQVNDFKNIVLNAAGNVDVADINAITIGDTSSTASNIGGNLTVNANGDINQTAALSMNTGTTASFNAGTGGINLGTAANDFDIITLSSMRAVNINDVAGGLSLGTTTITGAGSLSVTTNGAIRNDAGNIRVANLTRLNAGTNNISLTNGIHDFTDIVFSGGNINIRDMSGINIGSAASTSTAAGSLTITANGLISDMNSSAVSVTNAAVLNAGGGDINLQHTDFQSTLTASAANAIQINDATDLNLSTISASGLIALTAAGSIDGGNLVANRITLAATNGINNITTQTANLKADNTTGNIGITNTGNVILESLTTSGDITFANDADITMSAGSVNSDYDVGILNMTTTNGSFFGAGIADINNADVTAFEATFIGRNGSFGTVARPLVLNVKERVLINTRRSISPRIVPPGPRLGVTNLSVFQFDFVDASNAVAGEQLITVEDLEDIDPAIFSDVRNYTYGQVAIRLPRDQLFEDELKELERN